MVPAKAEEVPPETPVEDQPGNAQGTQTDGGQQTHDQAQMRSGLETPIQQQRVVQVKQPVGQGVMQPCWLVQELAAVGVQVRLEPLLAAAPNQVHTVSGAAVVEQLPAAQLVVGLGAVDTRHQLVLWQAPGFPGGLHQHLARHEQAVDFELEYQQAAGQYNQQQRQQRQQCQRAVQFEHPATHGVRSAR